MRTSIKPCSHFASASKYLSGFSHRRGFFSALLMLDMEHVVYVWQGWWPDVSQMEDNVETGSAPARFNKERQLALETTLLYCKSKLI